MTHGSPQCHGQGPAKDLPKGFWKAGQGSKGCTHLGRKVPEALWFVSAQERNVGQIVSHKLRVTGAWKHPEKAEMKDSDTSNKFQSFQILLKCQNKTKLLTSRYTPKSNPAPKPKAGIALGENQQSLSPFSRSSIKKESDLSKSEVSLFTAEGLCCSQD